MPSSNNTTPNPTPFYTKPLNHRHVVSSVSTNSELIDGIKQKTLAADALHLLTAETQSRGRGQHGRAWQSPHGNVYLSLYHPIRVPVSGLLSLIVGVELAKMPNIQTLNTQLRAQGMTPIGVKWANDLGFYQGHSLTDERVIPFHKLAGILIEPVWHAQKLVGVVMGVGLNVQATPILTPQTSENMSYQAIGLQELYTLIKDQHTLVEVPSLSTMYQQISQALMASITSYEILATEKFTTHTYHAEQFLQQFNSVDALAGLDLRITQEQRCESHTITGRACGIDTNGCLQLRQDNGKICALFTGRIDAIRQV